MGALRDDAKMNESEKPPSSESRPVQNQVNSTDPSLPAPDPNREPKSRRSGVEKLVCPPVSNPDHLDTPAYVAPTPPPPETEHKTFELQTVKIRQDTPAPPMQDPRPEPAKEGEHNLHPGLRQVDIPTVITHRVARRRSWTMLLVLVFLGVFAGLVILVVANLSRVEPAVNMPAASVQSGRTVPPPPSPHPSEVTAPDTHVDVETASENAVIPPPVMTTNALPSVAIKPEPTPEPKPEPTPDAKLPKPEATATGKSTIPIPLGPAEF